jgi:hypothetical protein
MSPLVALAGCDMVYGVGGRVEIDAAIDAPPSYVQEVLADSPAAYYRMGETSGVTCVDAIGDLDGTYGGTYALGAPGGVSDTTDTAVTFGPGNAGTVFADIHEFEGTNAFSLEAWVNVTNPTHFNNFVAKYAEPTIATGYVLFARETKLTFARGVTQANQTLVEYDAFEANRFVHVVGTYDGTTMRLYVDGVLQGEKESAIVLPDQTVGFTIGSANGTIFSAPMEGVIDEVAIYAGALPPARVNAHFLVGRPPPI